MKCRFCNKTDGLCYTSNPPKVKCIVTGKFHEYGDECDAGIVFNDDIAPNGSFIVKNNDISLNCIVCDEPVKLTDQEQMALLYGNHINSKICVKCKQAIMRIINEIEAEDKA